MSNSASWPSTQMTLLSRLRDLDDDAVWQEFTKTYSSLIYGYCRNRQLQHADALDVLQNALIALRNGLLNYDPAKGKFRGWFCQIIWAEIAKFRRKQFRAGRPVDQECDQEFPAAKEREAWEQQFREHAVQVALAHIRAELDSARAMVLEEVVVKGRKPRNLVAEVGHDAAWISRMKYALMLRLKELVHFYAEGGLE